MLVSFAAIGGLKDWCHVVNLAIRPTQDALLIMIGDNDCSGLVRASAPTGSVGPGVSSTAYLGLRRNSLIAALLVAVSVSPWQEARGQTTAVPDSEWHDETKSPTTGIPRNSFELSEQKNPEKGGASSPIELVPFVISASRHDEDILKAPASVSVIS
jgi:hypothetical protein